MRIRFASGIDAGIVMRNMKMAGLGLRLSSRSTRQHRPRRRDKIENRSTKCRRQDNKGQDSMPTERGTKPTRYLPEPCQEEQGPAHHLPRERGQTPGHRHLVRQLLRAASPRRAFPARLQARDLDDHARAPGAALRAGGDRPREGVSIVPDGRHGHCVAILVRISARRTV